MSCLYGSIPIPAVIYKKAFVSATQQGSLDMQTPIAMLEKVKNFLYIYTFITGCREQCSLMEKQCKKYVKNNPIDFNKINALAHAILLSCLN